MPDMGAMIYDTKTALVLRRDLAGWQMANVAAFLAGGLGRHPPPHDGRALSRRRRPRLQRR